MAVEIKLSVLTEQVNEGWKRTALAEHYGLPKTQMAQVLRDAGLKIRKFHAPKFILVDDSLEETTEDIVEEVGEDINVVSEVATEEVVETVEEASTEANW